MVETTTFVVVFFSETRGSQVVQVCVHPQYAT